MEEVSANEASFRDQVERETDPDVAGEPQQAEQPEL
jgi:hypothetical protein